MTVVPRLVLSAPSSGHGKSVLAIGLLAALAERDLPVVGFKIGPDPVDAAYLGVAAGRPGRNLDPNLVGPQRLGRLFAHGAADAGFALVQGTMGLYDSVSGRPEEESTAAVAAALRSPVVLAVDVSAMGQSVAALVHGFRSYDEQVWLGGVILTQVASSRHESMLRDALDDVGVPVYGALRRHELPPVLPSRRHGVVPALRREAEVLRAVRRLGEAAAGTVDLDRLLVLARSAPRLAAEPTLVAESALVTGAALAADPARVALAAGPALALGSPPTGVLPLNAGVGPAGAEPTRPLPAAGGAEATVVVETIGSARPVGAAVAAGGGTADPAGVVPGVVGGESTVALAARPPGAVAGAARPVVALAGGPGGSYSYPETAELLRAAGAEVVLVDPLRDEKLPPGTRALVVGGGLPESYAEQLSTNRRLCIAVAELARTGRPVLAEGAGLLWLARDLDGLPMCGVLDATATRRDGLVVGYRRATSRTDSVIAASGAVLTGYKQHSVVLTPRAGRQPAWSWDGGAPEGFVWRGVHASQLTLHWAADPGIAARLVAAAAAPDAPR
ncbi:cobyrinate/hydrogenobyrinate a,c-diamide synthase [Micromonospora fluostatini]|uniref:cobyrinate/hydrogenobyrinate a,c-diamide synthase n=1 Tax=Micromonospora sp. JCM 30529 TaxID=3421643 RepID=UPI003D163DD4